MADENTEVKESPVLVDASKLGASIAEGLARELPKAMQANQPAPAPVAPTPIQDVDESQIFEAMESGDKARASALLRQARKADRARIEQESLSPILTNGRQAINQIAELSIKDLPHYKTYVKEIKAEIAKVETSGQMITPDIWKAAYTYVVGQHADEIASAAREEGIRQAKEPPVDLLPTGGRHLQTEEEREPTTLQEVLAGNWKSEFKNKQRAAGVNGRSEDEEMNRMGFQSVQGFLAKRKEMNQILDEMPSLGLDREWSHSEKRWLTVEESRRLPVGEN